MPKKSSKKIKIADKLKLPKPKVYTVPASIWKRGAAFIIDILIINWVLGFAFGSLFEKVSPPDMSFSELSQYFMNNPDMLHLLNMITISVGILALFYFALLEYTIGQTFGKMLFRIYVIGEEQKRIGFFGSFISNLPIVLLFINPFFFILLIIDVVYLMFSDKNQRLAEKLTGIVTIQNVMEGGY